MQTMEINGETWVKQDSIPNPPTTDGEPPYAGVMLIETVTKYYVGEIVAVCPQEIVIRDACWVANTGRYHEFLATGDGGDYTEFEPCQDGLAIVGRGSIIVAQPYKHGSIRIAR